jgi:hypothetical protein
VSIRFKFIYELTFTAIDALDRTTAQTRVTGDVE